MARAALLQLRRNGQIFTRGARAVASPARKDKGDFRCDLCRSCKESTRKESLKSQKTMFGMMRNSSGYEVCGRKAGQGSVVKPVMTGQGQRALWDGGLRISRGCKKAVAWGATLSQHFLEPRAKNTRGGFHRHCRAPWKSSWISKYKHAQHTPP